MKDILLAETCPKCEKNITLMESVKTGTNELYLVKRCLSCGQYPVEEVIKVISDGNRCNNCADWGTDGEKEKQESYRRCKSTKLYF